MIVACRHENVKPSKLHSDGFHHHGGLRCKRRAWRGSPPRKCRCADCMANSTALGEPRSGDTQKPIVGQEICQ